MEGSLHSFAEKLAEASTSTMPTTSLGLAGSWKRTLARLEPKSSVEERLRRYYEKQLGVKLAEVGSWSSAWNSQSPKGLQRGIGRASDARRWM